MKFVTKENEKVICDFQNHAQRKSNKKLLLIGLVAIVIAIVAMFLGMYIAGGGLLLFIILMAIIYPHTLKKMMKKMNESNPLMMSEKLVEMEFKEDQFSYKTFKDEEMINFSVVEYNQIYMVDETEKYFFIYLAINLAICIAKEDLDEKEIDELRGILQSNCNKYNKFKGR